MSDIQSTTTADPVVPPDPDDAPTPLPGQPAPIPDTPPADPEPVSEPTAHQA